MKLRAGDDSNELKYATYFVDLTKKDKILYADPRIVDTVITDLQATFQTLTSGGNSESSAANPRLPETFFFCETEPYEPLSHLLNKIIDTASPYISQSHLRGLRFHPFGGEVNEIYGTQRRVKPDGIGIIGDLPRPKEPTDETARRGLRKRVISWNQIEVVLQSKAKVKDMVLQSGSYARRCMLSNQRRSFSLGIGFQYKALEVYVFVFHHAGLSSSRALNISTQEGFNGLVKYIVGILSIKDEAAYGLDLTRIGNFFHINNRYYESVCLLHMRGSMRGCSTIVHKLQAIDDAPCDSMESRMLTGATILPSELTYKLTYQIKGDSLESREGPLFSKFKDQFGIADVVGDHVCGADDPHGSTSHLLEDAEIWTVLHNQKDLSNGIPQDHKPEERTLHCIALSGEGLLDVHDKDGGIPSPSELLESILHAIIGHYNLFSKGILHRDISSGNVIRYSKPIERPALDVFACTKNVKYCRGFLIDSDHAIKWRSSSGTQSISGTTPFMSLRILAAVENKEATIHTALDDLESFLWLLIWGIVYASKDIKGAVEANKGINFMIKAWSGDATLNTSKLAAAQVYWKDAVFGELIKDWLKISQRALEVNAQIVGDMRGMKLDSREWEEICNELEECCQGVYEDVLKLGFRHLDGVKEYQDWNEVVAANARPTIGKRKRYQEMDDSK